MMQMPKANLLVVRMIADTNRDSTFALLVKVVHMLGVQDLWEWSKSPLGMTYKPTGQRIIFRGLDDPYKLSSIDVPIGVLCWAWFEEAYQIPSEELFDKVDQSIRGQMPQGYFPQITLTFNPWNQGHWLKRRFFDVPKPGVLAMQTNYMVNEFLSNEDRMFFEDMKRNNPRMYQVAGLGNWGVSEGLIFTDWEVRDFDLSEIKKRQSVRLVWGLDFGFSNDPNALIAAAVDTESKTIYVYHEWVKLRQTNHDTAEYLRSMGWDREQIICDSASPLNIAELVHENVNALGTPKGRDSVENGIQLLQQYHIVILPRCVNFRREISIYAYDQDKLGNILNKPVDADNHCFVKGTPVLTDRGQVPIERVKVGDMVMTHKGFRKVLASGITRPKPARIWRMTFEDGRILEATEDHPMITTDGVRYFNTVTHHDTLISWDSEGRQSNTMEEPTIAIPMQRNPHAESITSAVQNGCTDKSISTTTVQYQRDTSFIISTETPKTTTHPTWNAYLPRDIVKDIRSMSNAGNALAGVCKVTRPNRTFAGNGMLPRKVTGGIRNMARKSLRTWRNANTSASNAVRSSGRSHSVRTSSAQMPVNPLTGVDWEWITSIDSASSVERPSQPADTPRQGRVPANAEEDCTLRISSLKTVRIVSIEPTDRYEFVYDLTVEDAHTFFANGILVHNCMDALRYAVTYMMFFTGGGFYGVISGEDLSDPRKAKEVGDRMKGTRYVYST